MFSCKGQHALTIEESGSPIRPQFQTFSRFADALGSVSMGAQTLRWGSEASPCNRDLGSLRRVQAWHADEERVVTNDDLEVASLTGDESSTVVRDRELQLSHLRGTGSCHLRGTHSWLPGNHASQDIRHLQEQGGRSVREDTVGIRSLKCEQRAGSSLRRSLVTLAPSAFPPLNIAYEKTPPVH